MIYRKKFLDFKTILYRKYKEIVWKKILKKSLRSNKKVSHIIRAGMVIQSFSLNKQKRFYKSQYKPFCFLSYNPRVPRASVSTSRFYLTKNADSLYISQYQK